jgi:hypothetical protein
MPDLMTDTLYAKAFYDLRQSESGSASSLHAHARARGRQGSFGLSLLGGANRLMDLAEVEARCTIRARCYTGVRTVPVRRIVGSEGRSNDFDRNFCPLQDHSRGRWLRVAQAFQQGIALPPVSLIQVGDVYFVRDGHHRISVASAMGQMEIEAEVTVWRVDGSLPWETTWRGRIGNWVRRKGGWLPA